MADNTIRVRTAFDDTTTAGVTKMNREMQQQFRKSESSAKGLTNGFKSLAKAAGGLFVFSKIIQFSKDSVVAFDKQAKAEAQLATALGTTSKALTDQASALQKVTLFGDEQTIQAQSLIAAFVKEEEQITRVIPLVQDLAQAKGMDLAGAADLVSKTLGSSTNALSRYGIQVEGNVGSTERLESLTRGLEAAFGGSARAAAEAGAGPLTQFGNAVGDITEQIGALLLPMLNDLTKSAGEGANAFTALVGIFAGALGTMKLVQAGFAQLGEVLLASLQGWLFLVGKIPDKLLPPGWGEGIDEAIESVDFMRQTFKIAGEDIAADAVANFEIAKNAFTGVEQTATDISKRLGSGLGTGGAGGAGAGGGADKQTQEEKRRAKQRLKAVAEIRLAFRQREFDEREKQQDDLQRWYNNRLKIIGENEELQNQLFDVFRTREKAIEDEFNAKRLETVAEVQQAFSQISMDARQREQDDLQEWYNERLEIIGDNTEAQLELFEIFKAREADIEDKFRKERLEKDRKEAKDFEKIQLLKLSVTADVFGAMSDLLEVAGQDQKEFAALSKALAIVETTIDTLVGAQKAFNAMADIPIVGPGLGAAAAAAATITGFARVAMIASQGFQFGGIVPGNQTTGDNVLIRANSREGVFTVDQQQTLFDIASGRIQANRGAGIERVEMNFFGPVSEETTEDMIERLDDLLTQRQLSGIAA